MLFIYSFELGQRRASMQLHGFKIAERTIDELGNLLFWGEGHLRVAFYLNALARIHADALARTDHNQFERSKAFHLNNLVAQ